MCSYVVQGKRGGVAQKNLFGIFVLVEGRWDTALWFGRDCVTLFSRKVRSECSYNLSSWEWRGTKRCPHMEQARQSKIGHNVRRDTLRESVERKKNTRKERHDCGCGALCGCLTINQSIKFNRLAVGEGIERSRV